MTDERDSELDGAQIIPLSVADPGVKRNAAKFFCIHTVYEVDEAKRTVWCQKCGTALDPFQVLLEYALKQRAWRNTERLQRETQARLHELEAEERKVKARTRAARRKDATAAVEDERKRAREKLKGAAWKAREIRQLAESIARAVGDELDEREGEHRALESGGACHD